MLELARFYPQVRIAYTKLVTVTTDSLLELNELRGAVGAEWPFLSDVHRVVQQDLGIQEYTDPRDDPMIPHTFVLAPRLVIHRVYNGYWYWGRPSTADLHRDLRDVSAASRPDWRIDTEELRAKWDRGERDAFWPYGRSLAEIFAEQTCSRGGRQPEAAGEREEELAGRRRGGGSGE